MKQVWLTRFAVIEHNRTFLALIAYLISNSFAFFLHDYCKKNSLIHVFANFLLAWYEGFSSIIRNGMSKFRVICLHEQSS